MRSQETRRDALTRRATVDVTQLTLDSVRRQRLSMLEHSQNLYCAHSIRRRRGSTVLPLTQVRLMQGTWTSLGDARLTCEF